MKIFVLTFLGVLLPVSFIVILGALLMTVPSYVDAYVNGDAAGVLSKGPFCYCIWAVYSIDCRHKYLNRGDMGGTSFLFSLPYL